jgi:hypothetical protein
MELIAALPPTAVDELRRRVAAKEAWIVGKMEGQG